jgi:hypothetical protein
MDIRKVAVLGAGNSNVKSTTANVLEKERGIEIVNIDKIKDDNILRGMELFSSAYRLLALLPIAKKVTQKILIFEKD